LSATEEEEARAEKWLRDHGYATSRPTWLPRGKNPDFWAGNPTLVPPSLWAEVKSIAPDDSTAAMNRFSRLITTANIPKGLHGRAMIELDPYAIEQSVRWALKSFTRRSKAYAGRKVSLMFLQQTRDCDQEYRVEIDSNTPTVVWARASELPLNPTTAIREDILYANARVHTPDDIEITGQVYEFFEHKHQMQCALVARLDPEDPTLESISYMCGGNGQVRERTVRALTDANAQIKAACASRDAPGIVILTPQGPFGDDDQMMQAAIYGQYSVPVQLKEGQTEFGDMYHGHDGVFRDNKNRHISVAIHLRRKGKPTFFPNPHALHSIPDDAALFAGAVRASVEFA